MVAETGAQRHNLGHCLVLRRVLAITRESKTSPNRLTTTTGVLLVAAKWHEEIGMQAHTQIGRGQAIGLRHAYEASRPELPCSCFVHRHFERVWLFRSPFLVFIFWSAGCCMNKDLTWDNFGFLFDSSYYRLPQNNPAFSSSLHTVDNKCYPFNVTYLILILSNLSNYVFI